MLYFVTILALGLVTYGLVLPSSLFNPVILIGPAYGHSFGDLIISFTRIDEGLYALLSSNYFLGGSMRMKVSFFAILFKLKNKLSLLHFIMLVLFISKPKTCCFNVSMYN